MNTRVFTLAVMALAIASVGQAGTIGIRFCGAGGPFLGLIDPGAGAMAQAGWDDADGGAGTMGWRVDASEAVTSGWGTGNTPGLWASAAGSSSTPGSRARMGGLLMSNEGADPAVTVSPLPASEPDVSVSLPTDRPAQRLTTETVKIASLVIGSYGHAGTLKVGSFVSSLMSSGVPGDTSGIGQPGSQGTPAQAAGAGGQVVQHTSAIPGAISLALLGLGSVGLVVGRRCDLE